MAKHVHTHQERSAVLLWCACSLSHVPRFVTPWTAARKALLSMGILQARILEVSCHALLQGTSPTQGSYPGLPHCKWDSLPTESPGKSKNTGVGSLSLLQGNFLTQELNRVSSIASRFFTNWATWEAQRSAAAAAAAARSLQSYRTLCDPIDVLAFLLSSQRSYQSGFERVKIGKQMQCQSILDLIHNWRCSPTENIIWKAIIIAKPKNPWYM